MSESKHTPLPWKTHEPVALDYRATQIYGANGDSLVATMEGGGRRRAICGPEERANATLIVRAVNCHDAAVAMERAIEQFLNGDITVVELSAAAAAFRAEAAS